MDKLCRACLITKESFDHFLFEDVSAELYLFCTSVSVSEDDYISRSLCNICYDFLRQYSEFKRTCIQSQDILLNGKVNYESSETISSKEIVPALPVDNDLDAIKEEKDHDDTYEACLSETLFETSETSDKHEEENSEEKIKRSKTKAKKKKHNTKTKVKLKAQRKPFIYKCEICNRRFNYHERFEAHKIEHEGKTVSIHCAPCNKTFMTWNGLRRHNECEHTRVSMDSLKCVTCGKICKSRYSLKMHHKTHGDRKLCICDICGKGCTSDFILKAHQETHKENRERLYTCEHCGKKFFTKTILLTHVSRRHSGRRYICHVCEYPFTDKYNLSKHLLIHEGKKLYKCDICDKSYSTQASLVEHKRIHSGERPFGCLQCGARFVSRRRLAEHARVHSGLKPHGCPACALRFTQRGTLVRHMRVHDPAALAH